MIEPSEIPMQLLNTKDFLLEAEVTSSGARDFETRYYNATGLTVTAGNPQNYQRQENKWGTELRVYFNDQAAKNVFETNRVSVESSRSGYKSGEYLYRINNNEAWWELVEKHGLRLGIN